MEGMPCHHMPRRLAIIGASYLQLPLVLKAREMGLGTLCFAWPEGAVCKEQCDEFVPVSIVEKERIASICAERGIDGVATIASDVAVPTVCHVAQQLGLNGNSERSAFLSTNKNAMRAAFRAAGVRVPASRMARSEEDARAAAAEVALGSFTPPAPPLRKHSSSICTCPLVSSFRDAFAIPLHPSIISTQV